MSTRILYYDADCPLCVAYTGAFVKWGWMKESERVAWDRLEGEALEHVDADRSRHEIALYDKETRQVWYGVDSLLAILGKKVPLIEKIGHIAPVHTSLKAFYKLITYNRKIIAGKSAESCKGSCNPDFNLRWRITWIVLAFTAGLGLLAGWFRMLETPALVYGWSAAIAIFIGVPVLLLLRLPRRRAFDLAGHAATVGLAVGLALLPLKWLLSFTGAADGLVFGLVIAAGIWGGRMLFRRISPIVCLS